MGKIKNPVRALMSLDPKQMKALDALCERTRLQRSVLVREAIDDLLKKHAKILKGSGQ